MIKKVKIKSDTELSGQLYYSKTYSKVGVLFLHGGGKSSKERNTSCPSMSIQNPLQEMLVTSAGKVPLPSFAYFILMLLYERGFF